MVWKDSTTGSYEVLVFLICLWKVGLYEAQVVRELEIWGKHASPTLVADLEPPFAFLHHLFNYPAAEVNAMSFQLRRPVRLYQLRRCNYGYRR